MNKIILCISAICVIMPSVFAQAPTAVSEPTKVVRKINIKHADPYLIMLLLKGGYITQVEYSTIMKLNNKGG